MPEVSGPTKNPLHLAGNAIALIIVIIAVAAFAAGWYGGQRHNKSGTAQNAAASNLITYKNQQYGFQFKYPAEWGGAQFSTDIAQNPNHYIVSFTKDQKTSITLWMDRTGTNAVTSANVKTVLSNQSAELAVHDSSSYATVANSVSPKISSLNMVQIVNLTKAVVTAAALTYQITNGTGTCPQNNKFAQNSNGSCVERADYDAANQVLKSLQAI